MHWGKRIRKSDVAMHLKRFDTMIGVVQRIEGARDERIDWQKPVQKVSSDEFVWIYSNFDI